MGQSTLATSQWKGLRVVVMGLGQFGGGVAAAAFLAKNGANVCVTDLRTREELALSCAALSVFDIRFVLGEHNPADFATADVVVVNPAVPPGNKLLQTAREHGAHVTSEMELFLQGTQADVLLVSGTHGKSSTVTFLYQLLHGWRRPVFLGGNLGKPLLNVPEAWDEDALCILEISSYQLEALELSRIPQRVQAAGLTALAPDHLERHGNLERYLAAKGKLFSLCRPGAQAFLPKSHWALAPFPDVRKQRPDLRWHPYGENLGYTWRDGMFFVGDDEIPEPKPWKLKGQFQRDNVLLALGLAQAIGLPAEVAAARMAHLSGLPHRLQRVDTNAPGPILNNAVSTTPESTLAGLESVPAPALVLIGGKAKHGLDYAALANACRERGDRVFVFGAATRDLQTVWHDAGFEVDSFPTLEPAVLAALDEQQAGQTLLFSPACASFDAYPNFQARATEFLALVGDPAHRTEASKDQ